MEIQALSPEVIQDVLEKVPEGVTYVTASDIFTTFCSDSIDLLSKPLGSRILAVSDEWFAAAENLTTPTPPITKPGTYTYAGAWYDGWETRRHNPSPFDWVVFRLGVASGRVKGVEIDTGFFSGNHAPEIAVDGCYAPDADKDPKLEEPLKDPAFPGWQPIITRQECGPACRQAWLLASGAAASTQAYTHVRLRMFPDGGIGRFRLYGTAVPVFPADTGAVLDLAAAVNGGVATRCSDQHFGTKDNLLLPGRGVDMGDGWETKRSRGPHVDWVVVRLGAPGEIEEVVVDTAHFRGNFPQEVQVFAAEGAGGVEPAAEGKEAWVEVLAPQRCGPDREHVFGRGSLKEVEGRRYGFVKLVIIPDGGVKRLRVFGRRSVD